MAFSKALPLVHPGQVLREEFLQPLGWSVNKLAGKLKMSAQRLNTIVREERGITADTALRLSLYFGNSPEFWMNLQTHHDLKVARRNMKPEEVERIKALRAA